MSITSWILSVFVDWRIYLTLLLIYLVYTYTKVLFSGLPPGPMPFPVVGNLPQLGTELHYSLTKLGKTYKDVFTVYIFNKPFVVLNSYKAIKEGFVKHGNFTSARPRDFFLEWIKLGRNGTIF